MPGLNIGVGGRLVAGQGIRAGGASAGTSAPQASPATVTQTYYGAGSTPSGDAMSGLQSWHLGVAVPVAGFVFLAFLRWSLPR